MARLEAEHLQLMRLAAAKPPTPAKH
jgi:hypothetical protein